MFEKSVDYSTLFADDDEGVEGLEKHQGDPTMAKKKHIQEEEFPEVLAGLPQSTTVAEAEAPPKSEVKVSKADAVRNALKQLGLDEKPQVYVDWIKLHFDLEMDTQNFSTYKSTIKKEITGETSNRTSTPREPRTVNNSSFGLKEKEPTVSELKLMKELIKSSRGGVEDVEEFVQALQGFQSIEIFGKALEFWKENQD